MCCIRLILPRRQVNSVRNLTLHIIYGIILASTLLIMLAQRAKIEELDEKLLHSWIMQCD